MRTIIAPTDFSAVSLNAVNYAADLAVAINAALVLVNVIQIPMTVAEIPLTEFEYEEMTNEAEQELAVLINQLAIRTKNKIRIYSKIMVGSVEHELEEICHVQKPFAVVMATKGAGAAERFFLGSNTIYAVNNLEYPVLVVPHKAVFNGIKKVSLASDLREPVSSKPMEFLKEWLRVFNCKIDVINIIEHGDIKSESVPVSVSLQNLLSEFHPQFYFVPKENVEEGVYQYAKENNADLLVVIPKEHGLFAGLFHKSRSKPFILHPHIPVLAISE